MRSTSQIGRVADLGGVVEQVLHVRVGLARVVDDLGAAVLERWANGFQSGSPAMLYSIGQSRNSKPNSGNVWTTLSFVSMVAAKLPYITEAFLTSSGNSSAIWPAHPAV